MGQSNFLELFSVFMTPPQFTDRTNDRLREIRAEYDWLDADSTVCLPSRNGEFEWWTFGGKRANATLASALSRELGSPVVPTNFLIKFEASVQLTQLHEALDSWRPT